MLADKCELAYLTDALGDQLVYRLRSEATRRLLTETDHTLEKKSMVRPTEWRKSGRELASYELCSNAIGGAISGPIFVSLGNVLEVPGQGQPKAP